MWDSRREQLKELDYNAMNQQYPGNILTWEIDLKKVFSHLKNKVS